MYFLAGMGIFRTEAFCVQLHNYTSTLYTQALVFSLYSEYRHQAVRVLSCVHFCTDNRRIMFLSCFFCSAPENVHARQTPLPHMHHENAVHTTTKSTPLVLLWRNERVEVRRRRALVDTAISKVVGDARTKTPKNNYLRGWIRSWNRSPQFNRNS